jgi:hypothetical protein
MKPSQFFLILWAALFFSVFSNAHADDNPNSVFHSSQVSDGNVTVSNINGRLRYSETNGKDWKVLAGSCSSKAIVINSVKFIPETKLFIAVGYKPFHSGDFNITSATLCYSQNGINWNSVDEPSNWGTTQNGYNDIVYGNGYYMVVGHGGGMAVVVAIKANEVQGILPGEWKNHWTLLSVADKQSESQPINSVIFANGQFVMGANNSTIYLLTPPDGKLTLWVPRKGQNARGSLRFNQVIYQDIIGNTQPVKNLHVVVAIADDSTVWYSIDGGTSWAQGEGPGILDHANFNQIIYAKGLFVIAADGGNIWTSDLGAEWKNGNGVTGAPNFTQITYSDNLFKAVSFDASSGTETVWYSDNGVDWRNTPTT